MNDFNNSLLIIHTLLSSVIYVSLVSCIDFENINTLSTKGMYVLNNGVTVVTDNLCPEGKSCGFFNASQLEIPFFAKITFEMYGTTSGVAAALEV